MPHLLQIICKLRSATHKVVKLGVTKAYHFVIEDGGAVLNLRNVCPHACRKAHGTWLAGGVNLGTG